MAEQFSEDERVALVFMDEAPGATHRSVVREFLWQNPQRPAVEVCC